MDEQNIINEEDKIYINWFNSVEKLRKSTILKLIRYAGSPGDAFRMSTDEMKKALPQITPEETGSLSKAKQSVSPHRLYEGIIEKGIRITAITDPEYPERLKDIGSPPLCLYHYGVLPDDNTPSVAIVGARACSVYGEKIAAEYGRQLAEKGIQVISGMALGIDSIAQRACVEAKGYSAGILASGCDVCYPRENRTLYDRLKETGCVISEKLPGTQPLRQYFPARNRIISGLSQAVLLVEARERSGSLITADMALEQGREVYAVPGRINECLSAGCNRLIKQGAGVALSPREFMEDLFDENYRQDIRKDVSTKKGSSCLELKKPENLDEGESVIWDALGIDPKPVDTIHKEISKKMIISVPGLMQVLLRMCIKGAARQISATYFTR